MIREKNIKISLEIDYPINISSKKNSYTLNPKMLRAVLNGYGIDMEDQCKYYLNKIENENQ